MALWIDPKNTTHPVREENTREKQRIQMRQVASLIWLPIYSMSQQQDNGANGQLNLQFVGENSNENNQHLAEGYPALV